METECGVNVNMGKDANAGQTRDDSKTTTRLLDKNWSPLLVRKYQMDGWPLFISLICDANLNDLDKAVMDADKEATELGFKDGNIQSVRNYCGFMSDYLKNHYNKVKKIIESQSSDIKIEEPTTDKLENFRSEIEGEFEPNKDEIIDVLNLAIESEKEAQTRYEKIAEMFEDAEGKNIFENMANDERNHQKILEHQFYHMSNKGVIIWD